MRNAISAAVLAACLVSPLPTLGQGAPQAATVNIVGGRMATGFGFPWGDGTLVFQGKSHHFQIDGFNTQDPGALEVTATGDVTNLANLNDFAGTYAATTSPPVAGIAHITLKNAHGVVLQIRAKENDLKPDLGPTGISVTLKN